jgi:hypothetical protein
VWLEDSLRRGAKTTGKSPTNQLPPQVRDRPGDQLAAAPSARSKKVPHRPRGEKCGLEPLSILVTVLLSAKIRLCGPFAGRLLAAEV